MFTFSRPLVYDADRFYILAYSAKEFGTRVFRWTGCWNNYYVSFKTCGIAALRGSLPAVVTVGVEGSIHLAGPNGFSGEQVDISSESPVHRGVLRDVRVIDGEVYVVGLGRQIYRRNLSGRWGRFDQGIVDRNGDDSVHGFESIDGFSREEIYAVGMMGDIFWFDGSVWNNIESPTNLILTKVLCGSDGIVYAVGQGGVLLRGRKASWEVLDQQDINETFWDLAWHDGSVWVSSTKALYRIDNSLNLIKIAVDGAANDFRYLSAHDGVLVAVGGRQVCILRNGKWIRLGLPDGDI